MITGGRSRAWWAGLMAILALAAALRLVRLGADPDHGYDSSYITDEGAYLSDARLRVSEGRWARPGDEHVYLWLAPGQAVLAAAGFSLAGSRLVVARALSALSGLALVALLAGWAAAAIHPRAGLIAGLLAAAHPALVWQSRVALPEAHLTLAAAALSALLSHAPFAGRTPWLLAGVWTAAYLAKASAVALVPAVALAYALIGIGQRRIGPAAIRLATFLALAALAVAAWRVAVIDRVPEAHAIHAANAVWHGVADLRLPVVARTLLGSLRTKHALLGLGPAPAIAFLAYAALAWLAIGSPGATPAARRSALTAAAWLGGVSLFHSALGYQPPRYFLGLAAPACLLAAALVAALPGLRDWLRGSAPRVAGAVLAGGAAFALALQPRIGARWLSLSLGLALAAGAVAILLHRRTLPRLAPLLVAIAAITAGAAALRPIATPGYRDRDARARVAAVLAPGDVVAGRFAPTFTLETAATSLVIQPPLNASGDPFARFGVTKALLAGDELVFVRRAWPEAAQGLRPLLQVATPRDSPLTLYALERGVAVPVDAATGPGR